MKTCETEAIILNTADYGESDRLIHLFTRARGRIRGIAKGARRSRKRFVHAFEPCSLVELRFRERSGLVFIEACKLVEPHLVLRTDVERWGYAALAAELVLEMAPEGEAQPDLFHLLKEALLQFGEDKAPLNVLLLFVFRFLAVMGYLPALEKCRVCGAALSDRARWWWQIPSGRLYCSEHRPVREEGLELDLGTLMLVRQARSLPVDRMWRLQIATHRKGPLFEGLLGSLRGQIGKDFKSLRLIRQVRPVNVENSGIGMDRTV